MFVIIGTFHNLIVLLFHVFLGQIFLHNKVVDDEVLSLHGVLAHVVFEELLHLVGLVQRNLVASRDL